MLKGADLSLESQMPSNIKVGDKIVYVPNENGGYNTLHIPIPCKKLKWYDKAFAPVVNKVTKHVNKVNKMLIKHNKKRGEYMTEKTELPEVCIQYDLFEDIVVDHELNIEELKAENEKLKDELTEAITLVKDAQEIGETSEYFRTRIKEIDLTLIRNDADIKAKQESLIAHTKRRNELAEKCRAMGMNKIQGVLWSAWVTTEELKSKYNNTWYTRIV